MMRTPLNSLSPVLRDYSRSVVSRDWFPLAMIGALLLLAGAIAPPLEILIGIAR